MYRLAELAKDEPEADVVVPVPLHGQRLRERNYNQADLLGKPLADCWGLPYRAVLLTRTRPRPNQHILIFAGTVGIRAGRFCHTSGQPS